MRLLHYSVAPLWKLWERAQPVPGGQSWQRKPWGLWVSVEGPDDWLAWVRDNMPHVAAAYNHCTEVVLDEAAPVYWIRDVVELSGFAAQFAVKSGWIDWREVAKQYHGIVIAPFLQDAYHSLDWPWYDTWDCASGCIWDPGAIVRLVPKRMAA